MFSLWPKKYNKDKVVSNVMALPKSEFEIPDQEKNLAKTESNGNSEKSEIATTSMNAAGTPAQASSANAISIDESVSQKLQALGLDEDQSIPVDLMNAKPTGNEKLVDTVAAFKMEEVSPQLEMQQAEAVGPAPAQFEKLSLDEQLSQEVGFQSDLKQHIAETGLVQKMKEFESAKGLTAEKAQDFEQKVLEQLQQDKSVLTAMNSQAKQNQSDSDSSSSSNEKKRQCFKRSAGGSVKAGCEYAFGANAHRFQSAYGITT